MAIKHFVTLSQKWEQDQYASKAASTAFQNGGFISYNGSGYVVPTTAGTAILGVGQEDVTSSDVDYTSTRKIAYQEVGLNLPFFIDVTTGTATAAMVGNKYNVDTGGCSLDVSGSGTQIEIVAFISATKVVGKVVLFG